MAPAIPAAALAAALAVALALSGLSGSPAFAQETPPPSGDGGAAPAAAPHGDDGHEGEGPAATAPLSLRAVDLTAMIAEFRKSGSQDPAPVPLANRPVTVLAPPAEKGLPPIEIRCRTDADGRFEVPLDGVPAHATLEFLVPDETAGGRWPLFVAPELTVGHPPPAELAFVRVHDGPDPLVYPMLNLVATVPGRKDGFADVRVNVIAFLENESDAMWIGREAEKARGSVRFPLPDGFRFVNAQMGPRGDFRDVPAAVVDRPGGGREIVLREKVWPAVFAREPVGVRITLVSEGAPAGPVDFSFRAENPIGRLSLNLEEGALRYVPGDGLELEDGGANPPMPDTPPTHAWTAEDIAPGTQVSAAFAAGGGPVDVRVWYTLGALAFVLAGGALLGRALSRRRTDAAAAKGPAAPAPEAEPEDVERRLAELDERLRRGRISSFEHAARRAQIGGGPRRASAPASGAPASGARATPGGDPRKLVEAISGRVDTADEETLRRDVRSLLALARDLLR